MRNWEKKNFKFKVDPFKDEMVRISSCSFSTDLPDEPRLTGESWDNDSGGGGGGGRHVGGGLRIDDTP